MPKANAIQTNFTAGEITPRLDARIDIQKYKNGAATVQNFIVKPHGGAWKRPGTIYVGEAIDPDATGRLVPFQFNTEQAYTLLFQANKVWVYKDGGIVIASTKTITGITQANPAVVTSVGHGLANGDRVILDDVVGMTEVNDRYFTVANVSADTFQLEGLDASAYTAYASGGTAYVPVTVATDYTAAELDDLAFAQSADTLYIAHPLHPLAKLTRSSHTAWTISDIEITDGPFRPINDDNAAVMRITMTGLWAVSGITKASPGVVTTTAPHDLVEGEWVFLSGLLGGQTGMGFLNSKRFQVGNPTETTFELWDSMGNAESTASLNAYSGGGIVARSISVFGTAAPGTRVVVTCDKDAFEVGHAGALLRLWESGQSARVSSPVTGSRIKVPKSITNAGKVYGIDNLSGPVATLENYQFFEEWQSDWLLPTHSRGQVKISDGAGYGVTGSNSVDCLYLHSLYGVVRIEEIVSATQAIAVVVLNHIPKSAVDGTSFWEHGAWSEQYGYPRTLAFYEQRLWAAGSVQDPQTVWSSKTAAFENWADGDEDDAGLVYAIASERVDVIRWMVAGRSLTIGTASGEYTVTSGNQDQALTPKNLRVTRQTAFGAGQANAIAVGSTLLFAQRHSAVSGPAKKVREFIYSFDRDAYVAPDLTILAEHITGEGITELAYQSAPDSILWARRSDGVLVGMTYEREQEVVGWHKHPLAATGQVKSLCVIPGTYGDDLWMLVARTIDGSTRHYVETLSAGLTDETEKEDAVYLDCAATYAGASTSTISGLWHLEGETVDVLNDGAHEAGKTVTLGRITLDRATTKAHIGLKYTSVLQSLDIEAGAAAGTAQARAKRISQAFVKVHRSLGGRCGSTSANAKAILYRVPEDVMDSSPPLFSGYLDIEVDSGWERAQQLYVDHDEPFPFHVLAAVVEINTSG
ncbi:MAG: ubiquitin-activating E1 FCCH domain-containing protein [Pseudomonadota bacterium]